MNELEAVAKSPLEVVIDLRQTVGIKNTARIIRTIREYVEEKRSISRK